MIPAGFAASGVLALTASGIYMHIKKDKHFDSRYKLNWQDEEPNVHLFFLYSDPPNAHRLLKDYKHRESPVVEDDKAAKPTRYFIF